MTALVLSLVVMTSSGGLLAERTPAAGLLMGAAVQVADADLATMSLTELTAEKVRLQESMPGPGVGIALTAIGGGALLTGLLIISAAFTVEVVLIGLVVAVAAVPLLIIGPILIGAGARERRQQTNRIRAIDARVSQMNRDSQIPAPAGNDEVPPPPPMPPPGVDLGPAATPSLLLATF